MSPDGGEPKVGDYTITVEEQPPKPGQPAVTTRTLQATKDGKVFWRREIAGNPWSPPPR